MQFSRGCRFTCTFCAVSSYDARSTCNSLGFLIRRAFDFKTTLRTLYKLGVYLRYSPIFRKEVFKKQGMRFGLG